jgi:two-component system chemotaxis response regulator CheY
MATLLILAVDDSPSMREMLATVLRESGFKVVEAEDGVKALEVAKSQPVDVVLTDQNMPNMDGLSLVKNLRTLPTYRDTPIMMLTTESSAEMKQKGREAGATGWMVKPFDPDKLVRMLKSLMGVKRQGA